VIAQEKQRDQLGGGAITDGETRAKNASGNGPLSTPGICQSLNRQFHYVWNVPWSKSAVSVWLEYVMVKIISFSMSGICYGQNRLFQHGWNVLGLKSSVSAWNVYSQS
jgi:hypothetical protein